MSDQAAVSEPLSGLEICQRELHLMKTSGIIEVAVRNPSVSEYMEHWERRALKAEGALEAAISERDALQAHWKQANKAIEALNECIEQDDKREAELQARVTALEKALANLRDQAASFAPFCDPDSTYKLAIKQADEALPPAKE